MIRKIYISILVALCLVQVASAQDFVNRAITLQQKGELDKAKAAIDSAVNVPALASDSYTWYVRGFVYKSMYKSKEAGKRKTEIRQTAIESFVKSKQLDKTGENLQNNNDNLKFIATTFYNDAVTSMDSVNHQFSQDAFKMYVKTSKEYDPNYDASKKEIEYYNALASNFNRIYEGNRKVREEFFNKSLEAYKHVLTLDPNNISANYNIGILFYNKAVNIINSMDYDVDMVTLSQIQDDCVVLFKQSLPFMEKAHQLDPKRKETLVGLSGIYFSLNDEEQSKKIKEELDKLENQPK